MLSGSYPYMTIVGTTLTTCKLLQLEGDYFLVTFDDHLQLQKLLTLGKGDLCLKKNWTKYSFSESQHHGDSGKKSITNRSQQRFLHHQKILPHQLPHPLHQNHHWFQAQEAANVTKLIIVAYNFFSYHIKNICISKIVQTYHNHFSLQMQWFSRNNVKYENFCNATFRSLWLSYWVLTQRSLLVNIAVTVTWQQVATHYTWYFLLFFPECAAPWVLWGFPDFPFCERVCFCMTFFTADLPTADTAGTIFAFFAGTGSATHAYNKTIFNSSLSTLLLSYRQVVATEEKSCSD